MRLKTAIVNSLTDVDGAGVEPASRIIGAPHRSFSPLKHNRPCAGNFTRTFDELSDDNLRIR